MPGIAVVEDDERVLDSVQLILESEGWDVWAYATGEAFLVAFPERRPDCVILDPHLPGVSGVDVARAIARSTLPIICLTARPDSAITKALKCLGVRVVLTKPVTDDVLIEQVQAALVT